MSGLTTAQAKERLAVEGLNSLPGDAPRNIFKHLLGVLLEPMLLLLFLAGLLNFLLAEVLDAALLMSTVFIIIGISLFQERKTEKALSALKKLSAPKAKVMRDGQQVQIAALEVVPGDLLILSEGDRIPADAQLISATNLMTDESMLTGESLSIHKGVSDTVFSGTLVVSGHARAVVSATGLKAEIGKIGVALASISLERTQLQKEIDRIVKYIAFLSFIAAALVFVIYGASRGDWINGGLAGIAAAMALIPEEFPVIMTVFLALGAWKMSKEGVLARRSAAIETLGSLTVLCVDKTGTITMNKMVIEKASEDAAHYGLLACPVHPFDPMDIAFHNFAQPISELELVKEYPLSESLLAVTQVWKGATDQYIVATKGAPEAIAKLCKLEPEKVSTMIEEINAASANGYRVLGVAKGVHTSSSPLPDSVNSFHLEFVGLVYLHDPVREGVSQAVAACSSAGIRTIMLTGDYPGTALSIAKSVGLEVGAGVITGSEIEVMSDEELASRIKKVSVFARVVPTQKLRIIRALKLNNEIVAMTGDGVNDAPALRAADIGIAMGGRGTDVAREAAALVITDDDFKTIVKGIWQGRLIYANLRKAISYVVAVHIPIFFMALLPVFSPKLPLVLLPAQIAFLELIIDPASSVVFEAEEADPKIMEDNPRPINEKALNKKIFLAAVGQGFAVLITTLSIYTWAVASDLNGDVVRSLTFAALMIGNLALVLSNRSRTLSVIATLRQRKNATVKWVVLGGISILTALFCIAWLRDAFNLATLSLKQWVVVIFAGLAGGLWFESKKIGKSFKRS